MFYEDLSPYRYSAMPTGLPGVVNIGWLSSRAPYARGSVTHELTRKLVEFSRAPIFLTRGHHRCDMCARSVGNGEVWLSVENGPVYAAPSMVGHYVEVHEYLPPPEFLLVADRASRCLPEESCRDRILAHQSKLETSPSLEDILVPYYSAKIYWDRTAFRDLGSFELFLSEEFPLRFPSIALNQVGYFVRTECGNPTEMFHAMRSSSRAPFKCTFTLVHVGGNEEVVSRQFG